MLSPLELKILLHYHVCNMQYPNVGHKLVDEAIRGFIQDGVLTTYSIKEIADALTDGSTDTATGKLSDKGKAWVNMILSTPVPVQKTIWVDSVGNPVNMQS